jgi:hypothetical protein
MKIGEMEGTPEEIRDFCQNNGLNIAEYLEKPEKPLNRLLFITPSCLYVIFVVLLSTISNASDGWRNFIFLFGCCCSLWLAVNVQIRFKNIVATSFILIGGISFMLVALGVISPMQLLNEAKELKPK